MPVRFDLTDEGSVAAVSATFLFLRKKNERSSGADLAVKALSEDQPCWFALNYNSNLSPLLKPNTAACRANFAGENVWNNGSDPSKSQFKIKGRPKLREADFSANMTRRPQFEVTFSQAEFCLPMGVFCPMGIDILDRNPRLSLICFHRNTGVTGWISLLPTWTGGKL